MGKKSSKLTLGMMTDKHSVVPSEYFFQFNLNSEGGIDTPEIYLNIVQQIYLRLYFCPPI